MATKLGRFLLESDITNKKAGNTVTVRTEAEAQKLTGLPKGTIMRVLDTGTWYELGVGMALSLIKPGPVVVSGTKGSFKVAGGSAPPGWSVWGVDGRIVPPPGLYRVTTTAGVTFTKRTTDGKFVEAGDLVRIADGESITPQYGSSEDIVMVESVFLPAS